MALSNETAAPESTKSIWMDGIMTGGKVALAVFIFDWIFGMIEEKTGLEIPGVGID